MTYPQLQPLLELAASIERYPDAADIAAKIKQSVTRAATPSMAQNACEHIISMCHPKGWGDRCMSGLSTNEWFQFLGELSDQTIKCGQDIYAAHPPTEA